VERNAPGKDTVKKFPIFMEHKVH